MGCGGVPSASMVGVSESGDVAELPVGVVVAVLVNRTGFPGDSISWEIMESWED